RGDPDPQRGPRPRPQVLRVRPRPGDIPGPARREGDRRPVVGQPSASPADPGPPRGSDAREDAGLVGVLERDAHWRCGGGRRRIAIGAAMGLAVLVYLATGWTEVPPGEAVVVRRLGRVLPQPWGPGPHWGWPLGFDRAVRVRTEEVRRLDVGLSGVPGPGEEP